MNFRTSLERLAADLHGLGITAHVARSLHYTLCSVGSYESVQVGTDNRPDALLIYPAKTGLLLTREGRRIGHRIWLVAGDAQFFAAGVARIANPRLLFLEPDNYETDGSGVMLNPDLQNWLQALQLEFALLEETHQYGASDDRHSSVCWCSPVTTVALSFANESDGAVAETHLIFSRALAKKLRRPLEVGEFLPLKGWYERHGGLEPEIHEAAREFDLAPNRIPMRLIWSQDHLQEAPPMEHLLKDLLPSFGWANPK